MLTADLTLSWQRGQTIKPRYVDPSDARELRQAADLISVVGEYRARTRGELDEALDDYVGTGTGCNVLRGLMKLLTDRCEFAVGVEAVPVEIRRALFLKARARHPVV